MFKFLKTIIFSLSAASFSYLYYRDFYPDNVYLLLQLLIFSVILTLIISLPETKRKFSSAVFLFIPFIALYTFTYNFVFSAGAVLVSFIAAAFIPKKKPFTKILFTESNKSVFIKHYPDPAFGFIYKARNVFSLLITVIFAFGFVFPEPSPLWQMRAFPVDLSEKEVFEGKVIPSGLVTSTAWYDDNALLIADFFDIDSSTPSPGREAGLLAGDAVIKINGERALSSAFINDGPNDSEVILTVERADKNGKLIRLEIPVCPVYSEEQGKYLIGINYYSAATLTASVQTLSFAYESTGYFAATAHSSDDVYSEIDNLKGVLLESTATGRDETGLLAVPTSTIGEVLFTNNYGCYGILTYPEGEGIPLGLKHQVRPGKATLLSAFEGGEPKGYEVYVHGTYRIDSRDVLFLRITDKTLLSQGGITRGMSGSPIIQNGKLIGALSNMDEGGTVAYATYSMDMAHEIYANSHKLTIDKED